MERWRERLLEAAQQSTYTDPQGRRVPLDETTGIDILGNILESSQQLSPNPNFYGDFVINYSCIIHYLCLYYRRLS